MGKRTQSFLSSGKNTSVLLVMFISLLLSYSQASALVTLEPETQHPRSAQILTGIFGRMHYEKMAVDDTISTHQYELYLGMWDHNKSFFLQSDIDRFDRFKLQLDDYVKQGNLDPAYFIFNTFVKRVEERVQFANETLNTPFDFDKRDIYPMERDKAPWATSNEELDTFWRKRLKYEALSLKLTGKEPGEITKTLRKRYRNFQRRIEEYSSEDVFQVFMTCFAAGFDPHSGYMSPFNSENFGISMSLSFQGIGAQLMSEDDYTKVVNIIPGGPADFSKELWPNDKISAVGQGNEGELEDVIGMRLDDVVKKIRGKKGSVVRLEVIPADAPPGGKTKVVRLVRDEVVLTEREAKADTVEFDVEGQPQKLGVIKIPSFYADYEAQRKGIKDFRSTSNDVRRLIEDLKSAEVEGIVIDLRRNSGGFLSESINLTGLFIDQGPVVQTRRMDGRVEVEKDRNPIVEYDGPLVVLVDRLSASASEIFAAAIQDYGRGIVLGAQTFGKGTVQTLLPLDRYLRTNVDLGQARLTMAKFYRIAGGSTQNKGVIPDVLFPSIYNEMDIGESKERFALLYDTIKPADFEQYDLVGPYLTELLKKSNMRRNHNLEFTWLNEDIEKYRIDKEKGGISLNETIRRKEQDERDSEILTRKNIRRAAKGLAPLEKGELEERDDDTTAARQQDAADPWLDEAQLILADYVRLLSPQLISLPRN